MVVLLTRETAELLMALIQTSVDHEELIVQSGKGKITVPELQAAEDALLLKLAVAFPELKRRYEHLYDRRFNRDVYYSDQQGWPSEPMELRNVR